MGLRFGSKFGFGMDVTDTSKHLENKVNWKR